MITKILATVVLLPLVFSTASAQDPGRTKTGARMPRAEKIEKLKKRIQERLDRHPELKAKIEAWKALTPDQRKERIQQKRAEFKALTPEQRKEKKAQFRAEHPELVKHLKKKMIRKEIGMKLRMLRNL
ncbi:MAG: hypothetical protein ACKVS6_13700 [Planctomycetota bacterium]